MGGGREGKQSATRDAALTRCPRLAPTCLFLKAQAKPFFFKAKLLEPRGSFCFSITLRSESNRFKL